MTARETLIRKFSTMEWRNKLKDASSDAERQSIKRQIAEFAAGRTWIAEKVDYKREPKNICDTCGQAYTVNANYDKHDCERTHNTSTR